MNNEKIILMTLFLKIKRRHIHSNICDLLVLPSSVSTVGGGERQDRRPRKAVWLGLKDFSGVSQILSLATTSTWLHVSTTQSRSKSSLLSTDHKFQRGRLKIGPLESSTPPPAATTAPFPLADASKDTQPSSKTLGARSGLEFRKSQTSERYVLYSIIWGPSLGELGGTPCKQVFSCLRRKHLGGGLRKTTRRLPSVQVRLCHQRTSLETLWIKPFWVRSSASWKLQKEEWKRGLGSGREAAIFKTWAQLILPWLVLPIAHSRDVLTWRYMDFHCWLRSECWHFPFGQQWKPQRTLEFWGWEESKAKIDETRRRLDVTTEPWWLKPRT